MFLFFPIQNKEKRGFIISCNWIFVFKISPRESLVCSSLAVSFYRFATAKCNHTILFGTKLKIKKQHFEFFWAGNQLLPPLPSPRTHRYFLPRKLLEKNLRKLIPLRSTNIVTVALSLSFFNRIFQIRCKQGMSIKFFLHS